jgi:exopolysaccharide biosynthesis protein
MYAQAQAERRIFCSEEMVLKLGFVLMAVAVFSGQNMPLNVAVDAASVIKGYIQETTMYKEHDLNALFLLKENWKNQLNEKYSKYKIKEVDDGIVYIPIVKQINSRRVKINVVEVNRNLNPDLEIVPQLSSSNLHSKSKVNNIASKNNALIAINGTYFKQDTGTPLGTLVVNNEIISGPIYERVGLGISNTGFKTSRIEFKGYLKNSIKKIDINNINQPRMMFSQVLIYTPKWGEKSPITKKISTHISIMDNKITAKSNSPLFIPKNGYVISAPSETLKDFKIGDVVEVDYNLSPEWNDVKNIISGGPYLMKEGNIFLDITSEKLNAITGLNPRTAIGYTKDNVFILVTVDGRQEGSSGVTLNELARIMRDLGCYEAINLDGGSSTVMYVDGNLYSGSNIKSSVAVSNALIVRKKLS